MSDPIKPLPTLRQAATVQSLTREIDDTLKIFTASKYDSNLVLQAEAERTVTALDASEEAKPIIQELINIAKTFSESIAITAAFSTGIQLGIKIADRRTKEELQIRRNADAI